MSNKPLTIWQLAVANIKRKPLRTAGLIIIVALVAFVLFAGGILSVSLKNGLESMKERLGADLLVVPVGYDEGVEGIIVKGEPAYFYFDKSVETELEKVEGVKSVSSQLFRDGEYITNEQMNDKKSLKLRIRKLVSLGKIQNYMKDFEILLMNKRKKV